MPYSNYHTHRRRRSRRRLIVILCAAALSIAGIYGFAKYLAGTTADDVAVTSETTSPAPAPSPSSRAKAGQFEESLFTFAAPDDWQFDKHDAEPYEVFSYHGSLAGEYRYLDIYLDKIPQHLAVNRVVTLQAKGAGLSHGTVSDSCLKLAPAAGTGSNTDSTVASTVRVDGVDIMCDKDEKTHNIIAASAPGSSNKVVLTGPATGQHDVFFVYNDSVKNPQYTVLYDILESFRLK